MAERWELGFGNAKMVPRGRFQDAGVRDSENYHVASVYGATRIEARARARLIAAAPDLLRAIGHLIEFADMTGQGCSKQVEDARAAIAAAIGEQA